MLPLPQLIEIRYTLTLVFSNSISIVVPITNNDLERAADLLDKFDVHWTKCSEDIEAQSAFIKQIVERVYVRGYQIVAITLKSNCHLVVGDKTNGSTV